VRRIRFVAQLVLRGLTITQAFALADSCDRVRRMMAYGLDPCIGLRLVKEMTNEAVCNQQGANT
jgi:hypothetical protein